MTDLQRSEVNLLDEILQEKFEDLGDTEDSGGRTQNGSAERKLNRKATPDSTPTIDWKALPPKTNRNSAPRARGFRRGGPSRQEVNAKKAIEKEKECTPKQEVQVEEEEEEDKKSAAGGSVFSLNDELNTSISSSLFNVSSLGTDEDEINTNITSKDKMSSNDISDEKYNGKAARTGEGSHQNQLQDFEDNNRSNVSSSDEDDDDGTSKISNPSLSSASFSSDSEGEEEGRQDGESKPEVTVGMKNSAEEKPEKSDKKDYATRLNYILRDARFFMMKSNNIENIDLSKLKNVWSTPPTNESKINQSLKEARNVLLLFSVKESGKFSGFARLASESARGGEPIDWILPPGLSQRALGGVFSIDWISKHDLPFTRTQHLYNPWNEGKPVKIGRDGQEVEPHVAAELCKLFPSDATTDWNRVLRKSKDAAKTIASTRVVGPIGLNLSSSIGSRGGQSGFRDGRREIRGRFASANLNNNSRSFDYGRALKRRYPEEDYVQRSKRTRGAYDSYGGNYSDRRYEMNYNERYTRDRGYPTTSRKSSTHPYSDYARDYHHRPPPVAPLPYPPPPPFDSLPPPPRYYDGPALPEFPTPSRSRTQRSTSPYEKSVSDFLRRTDRRDRDNRERTRETRDRDHDKKYHRR